MSVWYEMIPFDTLFLRGTEPLQSGQTTAESLFPPPVTVVLGALRTEAIRQAGVSFSDFGQGKAPEDLIARIGAAGEPAPFSVTAILLRHGDQVYAPAPATWFIEFMDQGAPDRERSVADARLHMAEPRDEVLQALSACGRRSGLPLLGPASNAEPLRGWWLRIELLAAPPETLSEGDAIPLGALADYEVRTGIALGPGRTVRTGMIYSAAHVRLAEGVSLLVGLDSDIALRPEGTLSLGGERRLVGYRRCEPPPLPGEGARFLALAPVPATESTVPAVLAAGRAHVTAGWDLHRRFHKPTATWLPAGTVFRELVTQQCVPIAR